jgi:glycosyltransferase domain-containing protein
MNSRLTIVLPLKGRELFTLRFLWHANLEGLPYRFIIADGKVDPRLSEMLESSRTHFPKLDVEYIRYPDDISFSHYFRKMADAIDRVRTPYVMLADNDDFLVRSGLERSIEFLDANPDYVCCGGGIGGFSVYSKPAISLGGVLGPINRLSYRYMPYDRSVDFGSNSVTDRVTAGLRNSWSYYAVIRTPALQTIWNEIVVMDPSDLQLVEKFCAMRTLTLGKARSEAATVAYFRQYWTTLGSAFTKDWVHHLLRNHFTTDFARIVDTVADAAARADSSDRADVAERIRERIEPWLRDFLRVNYGLSGTVRGHLRTRVPFLLNWLKTRRRYSVPVERRALFASLRRHGAPATYLETLRGELARIEEVVAGQAFRVFLNGKVTAFLQGSTAASGPSMPNPKPSLARPARDA